MLFYPDSEGLVEFPSPELLKHRIIISTKPPKEFLESKGTQDKGSGKGSSEEDPVDITVEDDAEDRVSRRSNLYLFR